MGKRVPLYMVIPAALLGSVSVVLVGNRWSKVDQPIRAAATVHVAPSCDYAIKRVKGYAHVAPILYAEPECPSTRYDAVRAAVAEVIAEARSAGAITDASVYVRDFGKGDWFEVNGDRRFSPGSLMKVPVMLTMLKMAEEDPALFHEAWAMRVLPTLIEPSFPPRRSIEAGHEYSMADLLEFSIEHSDNEATVLLMQHMNMDLFRSMLDELGLPPVTDLSSYPLSAKEYAQFFKALYNASFVGPRASNYAMDRLLKSDFDQGLVVGIPAGVEVAHKFGESGPVGARQLHEAAIVFQQGSPYLVVVMTQGTDMAPLPGVLAGLSNIIYEGMARTPR